LRRLSRPRSPARHSDLAATCAAAPHPPMGGHRTCPRARCLRTCVPVTKPTILGKAVILEALSSVLYRPSMDSVSLGCSHHCSKGAQGHYCHYTDVAQLFESGFESFTHRRYCVLRGNQCRCDKPPELRERPCQLSGNTGRHDSASRSSSQGIKQPASSGTGPH
jgi:hypothetical protein